MALDDDDRREREQAAASRAVKRRARFARKKYVRLLSRLWIANGGGAVVTINYLGSSHLGSRLPAWCFLIGLISLSIVMLLDLYRDWTAVQKNEHASGLLGMQIGFFDSPSEEAGYLRANVIGGAIGVGAFLLGCLIGLVAL